MRIEHVVIKTKQLQSSFSFSYIDREEILLEMYNLNQFKASQDTDMPPKITRSNAGILTDFIHSSSNNTRKNSVFIPFFLKFVNLATIFEKGDKNKQIYQRHLNDVCSDQFLVFSNRFFFQIIYLDLDEVKRTVLSLSHNRELEIRELKLVVDKGASFASHLTDSEVLR